MHIGGGQPARGPEITGIRHSNGITRDRNVFVLDGQMVFITQYHKSEAVLSSPKVVPWFLPARISQLLAVYLAYVCPFADRLNDNTKGLECSEFIWYDTKGPWDTDKMTKILVRETGIRMGIRLTTQDYRHIAIAICRQHIHG